MIALSLLSLVLATTALAAPMRRDHTFHGACNVSASAMTLPSSFDPMPSSPNMVLMGVGVQNYTCNSNGTYDSVGDYAQMYDISCLYGSPEFSTIQKDAYNYWGPYWSYDPLESGYSQQLKSYYNITPYGEYYSLEKNGVLVPVMDLRSTGPYAGNPDAIVYGEKVKDAPSPEGSYNVDWVELKMSGGSANVTYRVDTVQGQPPSNCTPGSYESVKYSAIYWYI